MIPSRALFAPHCLGILPLPNRIVMAPLTRCRAKGPAFAPGRMTADYYAQRAAAGLIISEGIVVSESARGYSHTPGLYNDEQSAAWRKVTDTIHRKGGRIFAQLWHCGRISHSSLQPDQGSPVGPGEKRAASSTYGLTGNGRSKLWPCSAPRPLCTSEIQGIIEQFADAARRTMAAGFDGVEIHAANGYLLDQFLSADLNRRDDSYGGSLENRSRLMLEVSKAVADIVGPGHTGVRLSPLGTANDMHPDPDPLVTYGYLAERLEQLGVGYLHLNDQSASWIHDHADHLLRRLRTAFSRTLILCGGFDAESAESAIKHNCGDLIAFGRPFIANPDLVDRLSRGLALAQPDPATFYAGGRHGYVDYPTAAVAGGKPPSAPAAPRAI